MNCVQVRRHGQHAEARARQQALGKVRVALGLVLALTVVATLALALTGPQCTYLPLPSLARTLRIAASANPTLVEVFRPLPEPAGQRVLRPCCYAKAYNSTDTHDSETSNARFTNIFCVFYVLQCLVGQQHRCEAMWTSESIRSEDVATSA